MPRPLIIGKDEQVAIAHLKAKAARSEVNAELAAKQDPEVTREANRALTIPLPIGFSVTYTIERQPKGLFQHLSVGVNRRGTSPNPAAVDMILEAFGMRPHHESASVWVEDLNDGRTAVNILQRLEKSQ